MYRVIEKSKGEAEPKKGVREDRKGRCSPQAVACESPPESSLGHDTFEWIVIVMMVGVMMMMMGTSTPL